MIKTLTKNFALVAMLILSFSVMAQTVVISEIGFKSSASNEDYVELFNSTGSAINLTGYTLVPSTGSTVTLNTTIPANGFYVIGKNATEVAFEAAWGILIGGTSVYQNSNTNLSTTAGVTFSLRNASSTEIDNTTGYGITLGTRLYQCPVGSFLGNNLNTTSTCTPGYINTLKEDDLSHWDLAWYRYYWANGISPDNTTGTKNLLVKDRYWTITSDIQINDVSIIGYSSIICNNNTLTVNGDLNLSHYSTVTITGSGSVNVTGQISIEKTGINTSSKYNIWSTPFTSTTGLISNFSGVNPCDIYSLNASTQEWKYDYAMPYSTTCNGNSVTFTSAHAITDGVADGNFDVARGYFIPGSSTPTRELTGSSFNNNTISTSLYGTSLAIAGGNDWNLIGNPYPSGINSDLVLSNSNNNSLFNAIYVYNGYSGAYITLNSGSDFNISSCQGFFIDPNTTTDGVIGSIEFTNSMRGVSQSWRSNKQAIYLSIVYDTLIDPIQLIFDPESTDQLDKKHDAFKLPNPNELNFASIVENELLVFNGIKPVEDHQTKTIKLFVQTPETGNYDINLDSLYLIDSFLDIILEDKEKKTFTDLRSNSYTFSTPVGDSLADRFFIHLTNNVTSIDEVTSELHFSIFSANGFININTIGEIKIDRVEIYDLLGKNIYGSIRSLDNHLINVNGYQSGIYLVKVYDENGKLTTKRIFID